jgi:hypothetical protein
VPCPVSFRGVAGQLSRAGSAKELRSGKDGTGEDNDDEDDSGHLFEHRFSSREIT